MQLPMEKWHFCIKCEYAADDDEGLYCGRDKQCLHEECDVDMAARSPINRVGGKYYLAKKIVELLPIHRTYVEPFGGAMHVLFKKEPSEMEVYNDIEEGLVNFFDVVKSKPEALFERLKFSLYSRKVFLDSVNTINEGTDVERAYKFYIVNRQCFGGKMKTWGISSNTASAFFNWKSRLCEAHERLRGVLIENLDWRDAISRYDSAETLFYVDPPYIFNGVRSSSRFYDYEMSDNEHVELVEALKSIKGKFLLSGYENGLYDVFERVSVGESNINVNMKAGSKRAKKLEFVWQNF